MSKIIKFELDEEELNIVLFIYGMGLSTCARELPQIMKVGIKLANKMNENNPKWQELNKLDITDFIDRIQRNQSEALGSDKKPN